MAVIGQPAAAQTAAGARGDEQAALAQVRKDIAALERRLAEQSARRDAGSGELRAAELEVAGASRKLAATRAEIATLTTRRGELERSADAAGERLSAERAALAEQLRQRYMSGRQEVLKLLLSQDSPAALGRMLAYYDYFNAARKARIDGVGVELEHLAGLRRESERAAEELRALATAQARDVEALGRARDERAAAIANLAAKIADDERGLTRLRAEEDRLEALVVELQKLLEALPVASAEPFSRARGKLPWPAAGRVLRDYGAPAAGGAPRSTGILIEVAAGTPVRAIHRGQVAFSQWLDEYGLLILINHGEGYLSLYAHNESLLKEETEWVEAGETIAYAGDSGGRPSPALYFEIRQGKDPVDPHAWIGRTPR
jgi:septal ring factor EnvC (AmiA/AmiB activator)